MRVLFSISCFVLALFLQNCKKEVGEKLDPLQIKYFYQDADTIGGTVTIVGQGFSLDPANNTVIFNTTSTKALYSSHDTILVKVPFAASTGKIQVNVYSQAASSNDTFYVVTGRWKKMSDFPGAARTGAVGFSIGSKGYITLGAGSTAGNEFKYLWEYDISANTWTRKADFPGSNRTDAFCFVINNKAYVGCGATDNTSIINDFYEYDPASNIWNRKADFTFSIPFLDGIGVSLNGKGYVLTGESTNFVYEYNPQTNTWSRKADFPGGQRWRGTGFVIGDKGYIAGGYSGNNLIKDCWEYNPATDSWLQKASIPETVIDPIGFAIDENGFIGCGNTKTRMIWKYNPQVDKWERKTNISRNPHAGAAAFATGDKGYILVAYYDNSLTNEFWQLIP